MSKTSFLTWCIPAKLYPNPCIKYQICENLRLFGHRSCKRMRKKKPRCSNVCTFRCLMKSFIRFKHLSEKLPLSQKLYYFRGSCSEKNLLLTTERFDQFALIVFRCILKIKNLSFSMSMFTPPPTPFPSSGCCRSYWSCTESL